MANSNGKVIPPVRIYDIQRVLGTTGGGTLATLCTSTKINCWAKYKPVQKNIKDTTGQWDFTNAKWKSTATWWKGASNTNIGGLTPKYLQITSATLPTFMAMTVLAVARTSHIANLISPIIITKPRHLCRDSP